ncbi:retropepsin-like aspartic protease family protein [Cylindrospermum sp. FACHB-282]|uniref:retropepsin-like aspartic protease family protein n=1 Tax=Cylindrospermum sp. FACHB-282 TaxID=2692794 RepID=UPI0016853EE3|nr:retroviral-like aspartic protease family protein [Cylindrospermum sp. FACHB-282]MBD2387931.1 retroviral-like aspartic protease family protein [Cylindrospermum sp. FACHB-282]
MLQPFLSHTALICLSSTLVVLSVGCSQDKQTTGSQQQPQPADNLALVRPPAKPTLPPASPKAEPKYEPSSLELALDKATGALNISKSAQSSDDWNLVASQFQDAIALMKKVQRQSPNFPFAQAQISEYRRQIKYAQQRANPPKEPATPPRPKRVVVIVPQPARTPTSTRPLFPPVQTKLPPPAPVFSSTEILTQDNEVFTAPIKRRMGGTPIVEVTFNGQQRFDMIVDTGASGTVITQKMAIALGVVPVGKAKANTASARAVEFPVGYVNSMEVGGVMANQVPVAIAGAELETGLLGHDFFGNYDVTIKRNFVEFRPQSRP